MDRHVKEIGGMDYFKSIRSVRYVTSYYTGKKKFTIEVMYDSSRRLVMKVANPDRHNITVKYNRGNGIRIIDSTVEKLTDVAELDELELATYVVPLIGYRNLDYAMTFEGSEKVKGRSCYKIKLQSPNGPVRFEYYDESTGLLTMSKGSSGEITFFEKYKPYYKARFPSVQKTVIAGDTSMYTLDNIYFNEIMDTTIFHF